MTNLVPKHYAQLGQPLDLVKVGQAAQLKEPLVELCCGRTLVWMRAGWANGELVELECRVQEEELKRLDWKVGGGEVAEVGELQDAGGELVESEAVGTRVDLQRESAEVSRLVSDNQLVGGVDEAGQVREGW